MKHLRILLALMLIMVCTTVSAQLPSVMLKTLDGKTIDTSKLNNDGKPFIISFFATWCKPCNRELKAIHEQYAEWQEETGVKVIAISIDQAQNINKVKPLVDSEEWEYEILLDPNSEFRRAMGVQMIPYVLVCDGKGNIVYRHNGYTDGAETELIEKVRELIAQ